MGFDPIPRKIRCQSARKKAQILKMTNFQPIFNRDTPNYLTMTKYITYFEYCLRAKQNNSRTMALPH